MRRNRVIEGVKDYLWGDGLDFWNTPKHEIHDYPLTNPIHDFVIWGNQGGPFHLARHITEKFRSGDYDSFIRDTVSNMPGPYGRRRRYRPAVSTVIYKSSGSSSRAYQQNGSPGGIRPSKKKGPVSYDIPQEGYRKRSGTRGPCESGYVLQKVKGRWMCVRSSTRKR